MTAADKPPANASGRQFARNAASSYANLFTGILLSLVLTRVILRHLGAGTYGLWIVLLSIVGYLGLLDTGVSTAVVQRVARLSAIGDKDETADVIRTSLVFFSTTGTLAVLITVAVAPFLASFLHLGDVSGSVADRTLIILGVMTAVKFIGSVPSAVLFGAGRGDRQSQIGAVGFIVTQVSQVVVVLAGGGLIGLAIVSLGGVLFGTVVSAGIIRRTTGSNVIQGRFRGDLLIDLLRFGGRNTVIAISGLVSFSLDALIIGIILPVAQVAPYDIALSTANLTRNLTTYGSDLLLPTYAHFESVKDPARQARLFSRTVMATMAITLPILVALAAFGEPILKLWLGNVPPKTYSIMIALGFVTALELPGHQCFIFLTGVGRNQLMMRMAVVGATVNLIGSIIATFALGPIGPAIGSLPAVLVIDFTILPIIVCRYLNVPIRRYVKDALLPVLPAVAVAGALALLILWLFPASHTTHVFRDGVWAVISAAVVVVGAWAVMLAVTLWIEPDMRTTAVARLRRRGSPGPPATIADDACVPAHEPTNLPDQVSGAPAPVEPKMMTSTPHSGSHATPTWFGPEARPLFGWVHVPDVAGGQGVVLCPSIGIEGEASQLAYRDLAVALADAGCTVLRFDYDGMGDSAGRMTDPDRLAAWITSVDRGLDYLRDAGAVRLHLVGARLGATLAARAAAGRDDVASLVLWYPWTRGSQFVRYQRALRRLYAVGDAPDTADGSTEIPGFVLDPDLARDLRALDSTAPDGTYPKAVLVIDAVDLDTGEPVRAEFGPEGCERRPGTGVDALFSVELMRATVDPQDVAAITSYIVGQEVPVPLRAIEPAIRTVARVEPAGGTPVIERPVVFGNVGLFGVLAEPGEPTVGPILGDSTRVVTTGGTVPIFGAALFLNAGSLDHVGPGRQWVELSRRWAAEGIRCLRMDIGGLGDSRLTGPPGELSSYPPGALDDVTEGVRFLAPDDPREVVLLGLCSGAFHSLLAAPATGVGGVAVLNPLRLPSPGVQERGSIGDLIEGAPAAWGGGEQSQTREPAVRAQRRRFLGTLRDRGVFHPITRHLPDRAWWALQLIKGGPDPVASVREVVDSGAAVCIVLGPDEWPGIGRGRTHEFRRLARSGVLEIAFVPTLDHSFHVAQGRSEALVVLDEWVLGTGSGGSSLASDVSTIG
ncbi:MAG TPA: oligosaccharide flippase family protein [Acidimicrobiales bacterium]